MTKRDRSNANSKANQRILPPMRMRNGRKGNVIITVTNQWKWDMKPIESVLKIFQCGIDGNKAQWFSQIVTAKLTREDH